MKRSVKDAYQGIQTVCGKLNEYGCLFLCLCSIAEDYTHNVTDVFGVYSICLKNKYIDENFFCYNQEKILEVLTGKKWKKQVMETLPKKVPDEMYTVEKWYNPRTEFTHFKRRGFDTLKSSVTVREGKLTSYYCYIVEE